MIRKRFQPRSSNPDVLLFSDPHLEDWPEFSHTDSSGLSTRLLEGLSIFYQIMDLATEYKLKSVVCLGDIFEKKDRIPNHILIKFKGIIDKFPCDFYINMGNHDYNLLDYPILNALSSDKMSLIRGPSEIEIVPGFYAYFIPFQREWRDFLEMWDEHLNHDVDMVLIHQTVPGAMYDNGKIVEGEWNPKFKEGVVYLSGDIHTAQHRGKIRYLGAPYQFDWKGAGEDKFVYLFNSENRMMRPIMLKYPKFLELDFNETDDIKTEDIEEVVRGNYVKWIGDAPQDFDKKTLRDNTLNMGAKGVSFNLTFKKARQVRITEKESQDELAVIRKYAKENHGDLPLKEVQKVGEEIWQTQQKT